MCMGVYAYIYIYVIARNMSRLTLIENLRFYVGHKIGQGKSGQPVVGPNMAPAWLHASLRQPKQHSTEIVCRPLGVHRILTAFFELTNFITAFPSPLRFIYTPRLLFPFFPHSLLAIPFRRSLSVLPLPPRPLLASQSTPPPTTCSDTPK